MLKQTLKSVVIFLLQIEARLILWKYKPKVIGITGSVGKTSTKDALYTVLSQKLSVRKSEKSFNSEIGVPLTILGRPNAWSDMGGWLANLWEGLYLLFFKNDYPKWLILELGADHPGDIRKLCKWLPLDAGIVTGMGDVPVHVEFFPSVEAVVAEKSEVPKAVKKDGFVLLNADDLRVLEMKSVSKAKVYTYGFSDQVAKKADFHGASFSIQYNEDMEARKPLGVTFKIEYEGKSIPVFLKGTVGLGHALSVLAALATGELLGLNMIEMADSIKEHTTTPGRLRIIPGAKDITIIDDTYNSSPVAARLALDTLAQIETVGPFDEFDKPTASKLRAGRKIAVLGDMMELGSHTKNEHENIGAYTKGKADLLVTIGMRAKFIAEGALAMKFRKDHVKSFDTRDEALPFLKRSVKPGDLVLVKGSQSTRLEKIVEALMNEPERKKELLVRQDEEWQRR